MPSTRTPGKPYASAFFQIGATVCCASGTEMAHWLFWQKNTTGALNTAAKFQASWRSPSEVAPSPKYTHTTPSSPWWRRPQARPTACGSWVASEIW